MSESILKEQIYIIPLRETKIVPRWKRANKAMSIIKQYLCKHMKVDIQKVKIDKTINEKVWEHGIEKPPLKIKIRAVKYSDGEIETEII